MSKRDEGTTAKELLEFLSTDPEYRAMVAKQDAEMKKRLEKWRLAEQPLVEELNEAGFAVESAWDLVKREAPYPAALPILLKHLKREYPARLLEGMARAMAVPEAGFAWSDLVHLYGRATHSDTKTGIACALAVIAGEGRLDELIDLALNPRYGDTRVLLLRPIADSKNPRAQTALESMASDPELCLEVQANLKRLERNRRRREKRRCARTRQDGGET